MRITSSRAIRVTCMALASALCVPAHAGQTDIFLKFPPIEGDSGKAQAKGDDHRNQIEILSWSWGASQAGAHGTGGGHGAGKVSVHDISAAPDPQAGKVSKVDSISIKQSTVAAGRANHRLRNAGPQDGWGAQAAGEAEITLKGPPARPKSSDVTLKRGTPAASAGGVLVAAGDVNGDGRADAPVRDHGSVDLKLKSAWADCRVGARYPSLELGDRDKTYKLTDAIVTSCAGSGGDRPAESLSLNYTKIEF